jgi:hypothetical protein
MPLAPCNHGQQHHVLRVGTWRSTLTKIYQPTPAAAAAAGLRIMICMIFRSHVHRMLMALILSSRVRWLTLQHSCWCSHAFTALLVFDLSVYMHIVRLSSHISDA